MFKNLLLVLTLCICACAAGPNELVNTATIHGEVAGFWSGLWHGIIAFFTFIFSLFDPTVQVYEVHNNGNWYNLGFVLGAGILCGGGRASKR